MAINNINLEVTATANFSQLKTQVNELKAQMAQIQKMSMTGGAFNTQSLAKHSQMAMQNFERMLVASKAFSVQTVKMTSAVDGFSNQLAKGQLGMAKAWQTWRQEANGGAKMLNDLAARQTRLLKSTFIPDPNAQGYAKAITSVNASMKELGGTADYARIRASALNSVMREVSTGMVNFGKNTQWAGRQLTVGLTMPLVMFGAAASKAYLDFDKQMTSMLKVYGSHAVVQSQQTLDTIEKSVTELADKTARTLGVAMADTVEIAKTFSSIGLESKNLIDATEATTRLMKLGDLQAGSAANSMVSLQNVFKLQADEITNAVDFLNAAKHSTSTTMQDIIDAIPRVGPIIQQMGGTYKDFVSFIVAMKESGVPAAQGANAIKSMLASIIKPTRQARDDFKAMGIDLENIATKNSGNVMGMVTSLQSSLNALPQAERLRAIEELFGKFQFARVTALMNNLGTAGSQSAKVLELYGKSNNELAAVAQQELDVAASQTPAAQFQKMKATLQADLIPLGKSFLKSFISIGNGVDKVVNAFKSISKALGPVAGLLGNLLGKGLAGIIVIGPLTMLAGLFINLAGQLMKMGQFANMFRQGWKGVNVEATGFKGALQGIRLYYQEVNLAQLASNSHVDEFKEKIMASGDAFKFLNAQVEILKTELGYISGISSKPIVPIANPNAWTMRPSMPPASNDKMGGFVRPHMYAGSQLRSDWEGMSQSQRMAYPSLFSMQQSKGAPWLSGERGYLERGLSAQWTTAPKGVPSLLNSVYGAKPAIYGGATGISKEAMMAPGVQKLVQTHNEIIAGITTKDAQTTAQLQSIFGTERVHLHALDAETKLRLEQALETVIFEESKFKENMINTLVQEQAIIMSVETSGSRTNVNILTDKLRAGLQMAENERIPAIQAAWQDFNNTLTREAVMAVEKMKMMLAAQMAAMPIGGAAMLGAEVQATTALAAERLGVSQLAPSLAQDASFLKGTIPMLADGGKVVGPGGPTEDKVPAMLSGGEYVIKASSVNKYGTGLLDALNGGYATGGPISYLDGGGLTARGLMGASDPYVRAHLVSDKSGYMAFLPRSINSRMQSGGVTGFELHTALQDSNAWHLLNDTGKRLGIPQDVRIRDINSAKAKLLKKLELEGLEKTYVGGSFEKLIDPIIRKELKDQSWKILDHTRTIRTRADFEQALKDAEKAGVSYSEADLARVERNLLKRELSGKTSQKSYSLVPEQLKGKGIVATATTGGGGGEGLFKNLVNSQNELRAFEQHAGMFPVAAAKGGQIPAMLSNGEYVMSPEATAAHGKDFMAGINNGTAKFASGGGVGSRFSSSPLGFAGGGPVWESVQSFATASKEFIIDVSKMTAQLAQAAAEELNFIGKIKTSAELLNAQPFASRGQMVQGPYGGATVAGTAQTEAVSALTQTSAQIKYLGSVATDAADRALIFGAQVKEVGSEMRVGVETFVTGVKERIPSVVTSLGELASSATKAAANMMAAGSTAGSAAKSGASSLMNKLNPFAAGKEFSMGRMMGGMGLGMGAQMATSAMTKNMKEGAGKDALNAGGSLASIGGMFGPEGAAIGFAVGALGGGIIGKIKEIQRRHEEAMAAIRSSTYLAADTMDVLGIKMQGFSRVNILAGNSAEKFQSKVETLVQKLTGSLKNTQDPDTKLGIKNLKSLVDKDKFSEAKQQMKTLYATSFAETGDAKKADALVLATMRAAGLTLQQRTQTFAVGKDEPDGTSGKKTWGRGQALQYSLSRAGQDPGQMGTTLFQATQTQGVKDFTAALKSLPQDTKDKFDNDSESIKGFISSISEANAGLGDLDQYLIDNGISGTNMARVSKLMQDGLNFSNREALALSQNLTKLNAIEAIRSVGENVRATLQPVIDAANKKDAAYQKVKAKQTQDSTDALNKQIKAEEDFIKAQEKKIKSIQKEMDHRQKLWDKKQQQIEQDQTLQNLAKQVNSAQASGDLIGQALAISDYNAELKKQNDLKAKQAADDKDQKKIDAYQTSIDTANTKINKLNDKISTLTKTQDTAAQSATHYGKDAEAAVESVIAQVDDGKITGKTSLVAALKGAGIPEKDIGKYAEKIVKDDNFGKLAAAAKGLNDVMAANKGMPMDTFKKQMILAELYAGGGKITPEQALADANKMTGALGSKPKPKKTGYNSLGTKLISMDGQSWTYAEGMNKGKPYSGTVYKKYNANQSTMNAQGNILRAADGGYISGAGTGTSDSIPALLSNGEYVVKASAVNKLGRGFLDGINQYANGGPVRLAGGTGGSTLSSGAPTANSSLFNIAKTQVPMFDGMWWRKAVVNPQFKIPFLWWNIVVKKVVPIFDKDWWKLNSAINAISPTNSLKIAKTIVPFFDLDWWKSRSMLPLQFSDFIDLSSTITAADLFDGATLSALTVSSLTLAGGASMAVTGTVSVSNFPASQAVTITSGDSIKIIPGATAIPVTGAFSAGIQAVKIDSGDSIKIVSSATAPIFAKISKVGTVTAGFADGGYISGAGGPTSDMIPAMLSNGEYVIKASAVSSYGKGMLDAINNKKFATGGLAKAYAIGGSVGNNDSSALNDNSVYNINVTAATNANPDDIAQAVMKAIQREKGSMSTNRYAGSIR